MTTRRTLLKTGAAAAAFGIPALRAFAGDPPIVLSWSDLVPEGGGTSMEKLRNIGVIQHGQLNTAFDQEAGALLTDEYDGALVRIPGYLVPLDFLGTGVTVALLVPYVGACIHVPPPPPNQLIFVTTERPYESTGLFEPVYVTGIFGAAAAMTELAEVGYAMDAYYIEPYS